MPSSDDFRRELMRQLNVASQLSADAIEINSGKLHRSVGGYPGVDHRMPICCDVMKSVAQLGDKTVHEPPKGKGASLTIRYVLPR